MCWESSACTINDAPFDPAKGPMLLQSSAPRCCAKTISRTLRPAVIASTAALGRSVIWHHPLPTRGGSQARGGRTEEENGDVPG